VPFPVGAADDDPWDSAEDDLAKTRRRTWGKRGNMGFFFLGCSKTDVLFRFLIFYFLLEYEHFSNFSTQKLEK
jgi:hypothetical protein